MGEAHFYNLDGDEIEKQTTEIKWNAEAAEKAGFEHFMMKEIHEQPKAVKDTLGSVIKDNCIDLSSVELTTLDSFNCFVNTILWIYFHKQMYMIWHDFHFNDFDIQLITAFFNQLL